jgi:hypothetical protein
MERKTAVKLFIILFGTIALVSFINLILLDYNTSIGNELTKLLIPDCWWCD